MVAPPRQHSNNLRQAGRSGAVVHKLEPRLIAEKFSVNRDAFTAGKPRMWTPVRLRNLGVNHNYDLAPDGKRIAAIVADGANTEKSPTNLTVLLNFSDELRRNAPAGQ